MCSVGDDLSGVVFMCAGSIALLVCLLLSLIAMKMYGKASPLKRALALRILQEAGYDVVETLPGDSIGVAINGNQSEIYWAIKTLIGKAPVLVDKNRALVSNSEINTNSGL